MTDDILFFFDREPLALSLFELLFERAMACWPSSTLRKRRKSPFPTRGDTCSPPVRAGAAAA